MSMMGQSLSAVRASDAKQVWQFTMGQGKPTIVAADGVTVIAGTASDSDLRGRVSLLRSSDGAALWNYECLNGSFFYQPVIGQGVVYVGSEDGKVYAFSEESGAVLWQYDTGDLVTSTPALANGNLYVGANGYVTALGAHDGTVVWRHQVGSGNVGAPSPAVADGVVYAVSDDGNGYLSALQAGTGKELWRYNVGGVLYGARPLVVDGGVFYGETAGGNGSGYVYALRASDCAPAWRLEVGSWPPSYTG